MTEANAVPPRHVLKIQAVAAALYPRRRAAAVLGLLAVLLAYLSTGIKIVRNDERGLRRRFGRLVDGRVSPGATFVVPPVETLDVVSVGTVRALPLSPSQTEALEFITGDENLVQVTGQLQYRIEDAGLFRTAQRDPESVLLDSAVSALASEISKLPVDEVLTTGKSAIQEAVRSSVEASEERSRTGILLLQVSLNAVGPPSEAADAFNAVSDAAAGRERRVSEAQGRAAQALSLARAHAETLVRQAQSEARETSESARAAQKSFMSIADEVTRSPISGRERLYRDIVSGILKRARVNILPPQTAGRRLRILIGQSWPPGQSPDPASALLNSLLSGETATAPPPPPPVTAPALPDGE